jgi:hypothetical protein
MTTVQQIAKAKARASSKGFMTAAQQIAKAKAKANREKHEKPFEFQISALGLPPCCREYQFAAISVGWNCSPGAKNDGMLLRSRLAKAGLKDWRFDFAWPDLLVALEIEGSLRRGRHTSPKGFTEDCRKYNAATLLGWRVYRVTGDMVHSGDAINLVARALELARGK